jgi:agmatine/peptidylarginine deiminase
MIQRILSHPIIKVVLVLGLVLLAVIVVYFVRAYPFYVAPRPDLLVDAEIEIYNLNGATDNHVVPEWIPASGVLIACPFQIPYELLREIASDHKLYLITKDEEQKQNCLNELSVNDTNLNNVEFIFSENSDGHEWTRDWGPYTVSIDSTPTLVDANFHDYTYSSYDSQRKKIRTLSDWIPILSTEHDDEAPGSVADYFSLNREEVSIALTGGSVMFDGQGTLFINRVVIDENEYLGHSFDEFKRQLASTFGINRLIVLPNYESWGIQHIDCLLKLLDEDRILMKKLDPSHPDYQRVELIAEALSEIRTLDGKTYDIIRIDTPNYAGNASAPYTNSLIFNKKVFVPLMGIPGDEDALDTWKAAMPGYEVFGYRTEEGMHPWYDYDALHCRTKSIYLHGDLR